MGESPITVRAVLEPARFPVPTGRGVLPADVAVEVARDSAEANRLANLLRVVFSFPAMLGALLVGAVFVARRSFAVDPDLWWHIKNGQNILATHRWPTTDPFSFTVAGQPWISTEWLGDVLFAGVARIAGLPGLEALLIVLGGAVMLALYALATLRSGNSKAGFVAAVVLLVFANASFSLRPQMLGYLFLILTVIALEQFRQGRSKYLWFLPLLFFVWVNAHGSFVMGMVAIGAYWAGGLFEFRLGGIESRRWTAAQRLRIEIVFLLSLIGLTITPYGSQLAVYPFQVASSLPIGVANVLEWQPMPFNILGGKLFLGLLFGFFLAQMAFRFTWRLEELGLFLFGTMMACLHVRFLLLFVPFFAPLLGTMLGRWLPGYERSRDKYFINAGLIAGAAAAMVWFFPSRGEMEKFVARDFPVRAVEYMEQHAVPGPMLNSYAFGGYLVWKDIKVFVDGRADPYERGGSLADYFYMTHLKRGAPAVLRGYGVNSCLLEPDEPLATLLASLPGWQKVYADNLSVLFVKRNSADSSDAQRGLAAPGQKE
jgi:hypothetical protein